MNNPGYVRDYRKQLFLGRIPDPHGVGVAVTNRAGTLVGVYIDDTTPNIRMWISKAVEAYPKGIVFVAKAQGEVGIHYAPKPPIVELQEWYPYQGYALDKLPEAEAYILQWDFWGFRGHKPISRFRRLKLLAQALRHRPRYIFLY